MRRAAQLTAPRAPARRHAPRREGPQKLAFTIPIHEPLPPQYYVRVVSEGWLQVRPRPGAVWAGLQRNGG